MVSLNKIFLSFVSHSINILYLLCSSNAKQKKCLRAFQINNSWKHCFHLLIPSVQRPYPVLVCILERKCKDRYRSLKSWELTSSKITVKHVSRFSRVIVIIHFSIFSFSLLNKLKIYSLLHAVSYNAVKFNLYKLLSTTKLLNEIITQIASSNSS